MWQLETLLDDGDQHVGADGNADSRLYRVLAGAEKRLDARVLLDSVEEQLHLPALPIQICDQGGRQREIVGQERDALAGFLVLDHHPAQGRGIAPAPIEDRQRTGLVAQYVGVEATDGVGITSLELGVALGAGDEEVARLMDGVQAGEVQLAAIHQVERARLDHQLVEDIDLVGLAVGDVDEARDRYADIQERVQLDGGLGRAERRPWIDRQAQFDRRGIGGVGRRIQIDAQRLLAVLRTGDADQVLRKVGVHLPGTCRIGTRRVARHRLAAKTNVIQARCPGAQVHLDVAQRLAPSQLGERHGEGLIQAGEAQKPCTLKLPRCEATQR
jgi:hypothetical protein